MTQHKSILRRFFSLISAIKRIHSRIDKQAIPLRLLAATESTANFHKTRLLSRSAECVVFVINREIGFDSFLGRKFQSQSKRFATGLISEPISLRPRCRTPTWMKAANRWFSIRPWERVTHVLLRVIRLVSLAVATGINPTGESPGRRVTITQFSWKSSWEQRVIN